MKEGPVEAAEQDEMYQTVRHSENNDSQKSGLPDLCMILVRNDQHENVHEDETIGIIGSS